MQRKLISIAETKLILCKDTELSLKHKVFFTNLCEKPMRMSQRRLLLIGNLLGKTQTLAQVRHRKVFTIKKDAPEKQALS